MMFDIFIAYMREHFQICEHDWPDALEIHLNALGVLDTIGASSCQLKICAQS